MSEYWSGLTFPSPEDLPHPGIEPRSPTLQADYLPILGGAGKILSMISLPCLSHENEVKVLVS